MFRFENNKIVFRNSTEKIEVANKEIQNERCVILHPSIRCFQILFIFAEVAFSSFYGSEVLLSNRYGFSSEIYHFGNSCIDGKML